MRTRLDPAEPHACTTARTLPELDTGLIDCRACPRLVGWREQVASAKRRAYLDWDYWGRPVPGFGPSDASIALVGLAPAAHGGNRTGRAFTGDAAGDFLYASLHAVGLASQPTSTRQGDGLELRDVRITMPVHCAPPENKPTPAERDACRPWLVRELGLLRPTLRVVVVLGSFAWHALLPALSEAGWVIPRPLPKFGHKSHAVVGAEDSALHLLGCYHPSQRNTFTGTLTADMLEDVLREAVRIAGAGPVRVDPRLPG